MKPLINLDDLKFESHEHERFKGSYGVISDLIGAQSLGYNLTIVPPGHKNCPFHNHHSNEEMFLILEGEGTLRYGDREYPLRKNDVLACPAGGKESAHQIINTGKTDLKYLCVSTRNPVDICEYPDSGKVGAMVGSYENPKLRGLFKLSSGVDYWEGES